MSDMMVGAVRVRPPFTLTQMQELQTQALMFKCMITGEPVPPELIYEFRRHLIASGFYYPGFGYPGYTGKKVDLEPGRCRRTDGKKWRCAKDAYPDSKYCDRHMHRGRNRSRKLVETQIHPHTRPQSKVTSVAPAIGSSGSGSGSGSIQNIPLPLLAGGSNSQGSYLARPSSSKQPIDSGSYGIGIKDYSRYLQGMKTQLDERAFFSEASGSARGVGMDSSVNSSWRLMPSNVSSFAMSTVTNGSALQGSYPQLQPDLGHATMSLLSNQQQQQPSFYGSGFGSPEPLKHETQSLRPFLEEWPNARDSWSDLDDERSNRTAFSTTQLSMSIPRASSDFSATSSRSPSDE